MFIIVEYQINAEDQAAIVPPASYATLEQAESAYYSVLSSAAISTVAKHGAILFTEGGYLMQKCYVHQNQNEPEESIEN